MATTQRGRGAISPSRIGKRAAVAWLEPDAVKQLNMVAIQRDTEVQKILAEAINMWFAANGLPRFDATDWGRGLTPKNKMRLSFGAR